MTTALQYLQFTSIDCWYIKFDSPRINHFLFTNYYLKTDMLNGFEIVHGENVRIFSALNVTEQVSFQYPQNWN